MPEDMFVFYAELPGPCDSNPCRGRGTCITNWENRTYDCVCKGNFTGVNCQHGT